MDKSFPIVLMLFRRPKYSTAVMDALAACRNIENHVVHIHIDQPSDSAHREGWLETIEAASKHRGLRKVIELAPMPRSCNGSVHHALGRIFKTHRYAAYFEDDTVPSDDCIEYFEECSRLAEDQELLTVSAYSSNPGGGNIASARDDRRLLCAWGFATWANKWNLMRILADRYDNPANNNTWDSAINVGIERSKRRFRNMYPCFSRTQNIGAEDGYTTTPEKHAQEHVTTCWAGPHPPMVNWAATVDYLIDSHRRIPIGFT